MAKNQENMELKMGGLGIASSRAPFAYGTFCEATGLLSHAALGSGGANKRNAHMKKLMIAATAALCAAVGFADGIGGIPSQNVVGYYNEEAPQAKFVLGTASLETIGGGIKLSSFTGLTPVAIDWEGDYMAFYNTAPQLQIWNGSGYDFVYYVSNAWFDNETEDGDYKEGWCDMDGVLCSDDYVITPGYAYWIKNVPDSKPLNIAGQVKQAEKVQVACPSAFMLIGNPYPSAISLNKNTDMTSADIKPVAIDWEGDYMAFYNTATQLQIWNGTGYDFVYYVSNAWFDNGTKDGDYKEGWCDMDGVLLEGNSIPVGYGFWIRATSAPCTLDFNNPIK